MCRRSRLVSAACTLLLFFLISSSAVTASSSHNDPLASLHELIRTAPRITQQDLQQIPIHIPSAAVADTNDDASTSFIASESLAPISSQSSLSSLSSSSSDVDTDLTHLNALSSQLTAKTHVLAHQQHTIQNEENKLQRLRSLIRQNKSIVSHNKAELRQAGKKYLNSVNEYTHHIEENMKESLKAKQEEAKKQVESIIGKLKNEDVMTNNNNAAAASVVDDVQQADRSMLTVDSSADSSSSSSSSSSAIHAQQLLEAHLSAEHLTSLQQLLERKAKSINEQQQLQQRQHVNELPTKNQQDFAEFTRQLAATDAAENQRTLALRQALHANPIAVTASAVEASTTSESEQPQQQQPDHSLVQHSSSSSTSPSSSSDYTSDQKSQRLEEITNELHGEPITMFLETQNELETDVATNADTDIDSESEMETDMESELSEDDPSPALVAPVIDASVTPIPATPATAPAASKPVVLPCPKGMKFPSSDDSLIATASSGIVSLLEISENTKDDDETKKEPVLVAPIIEEGTIGLPTESTPQPIPSTKIPPPCPKGMIQPMFVELLTKQTELELPRTMTDSRQMTQFIQLQTQTQTLIRGDDDEPKLVAPVIDASVTPIPEPVPTPVAPKPQAPPCPKGMKLPSDETSLIEAGDSDNDDAAEGDSDSDNDSESDSTDEETEE